MKLARLILLIGISLVLFVVLAATYVYARIYWFPKEVSQETIREFQNSPDNPTIKARNSSAKSTMKTLSRTIISKTTNNQFPICEELNFRNVEQENPGRCNIKVLDNLDVIYTYNKNCARLFVDLEASDKYYTWDYASKESYIESTQQLTCE